MNFWLNKNILLTLLFAGACAASAALAYYSLTNLGTAYGTDQSDTPDTFMENVRYTNYDAQGAWESSFYTPRMTHYPKQKTALLDNPRLNARGENQLSWIITAKHGKAQDDGKIIYLSDQVQIRRFDSASNKTATLDTTALTAYPKRKYLETNQPVTIIQPGSTVKSTGFTANLNSGDIQLLSQISSVYVEQH